MKNILSPDWEYKYITVFFLILVSVVLALAAVGALTFDADKLRRLVPDPGNLATSPTALGLLRQKNTVKPEKPADVPLDRVPDRAPVAAVTSVSVPEQNVASENQPVAQEIKTVPQTPSTASDASRSDMIMISKIGVATPIITPQTTDAVQLKKLLDSGAILYPDSAVFGALGQAIVLGHSAPPGWPVIKHDTIFSRLAELVAGDKVVVVYNDRTYNYTVIQSEIIEAGGDIPAMAQGGSSLALVTCWPPGRNLKRFVVQASLDSVE